MSHEEHREVLKFAVETARGRIPVIAGAGSNATSEALSLTRYAAEVGADATLQVSPYYNKPSQEGIYLHYKKICDEVDLPMILYNIPGRTGKEIAVETVARLSKLRQIKAVKEAGGSVERVSQTLQACDIAVLSGDDSLTLPMMAVGARGVISVVANVVPEDVKAMVAAAERQDYAAARKLHYKMLPLVQMCFVENNPAGIKCAMNLAGMIGPETRLPVCPMSDANIAKMRKVTSDYGII
jgi:4-hydroxy-tetrahydrodipicolinate synthase